MNKNNANDLYEDWLLDYQEDLNRIIGKYRLGKHCLSHEEVLSEVNLSLMKSKNKLVPEKVFNFDSFKKIAYCHTRNIIRWTADGVSLKDKKYHHNKVDSSPTESDDSSFDLVCKTLVENDNFFESLNEPKKYQNIKKWILDYSHFLSPRQKNVLSFLLKGHQLNEIAAALDVSHQAISFMLIEINAKINSYIKKSHILKPEAEIIDKGRNSINYLFGESRKDYRSQFNTSLKKCI